jgi:mannose/fructose/N-acetylgalactosamine-specific phosphotransferase system component IIB
MNAEQAVKLAESGKGLQAILIGGMHVVAGKKAIEKAESRGVEFAYLHRHEGKIVSIPNYDTRD